MLDMMSCKSAAKLRAERQKKDETIDA